MNHATINDRRIGTGEALILKQVFNGVLASKQVFANESPPALELTLTWPAELPARKIDLILLVSNDKHPFMAVFRFNSFGLEMVYSEHSRRSLFEELAKTREVTVREVSECGNREYKCELKHSFD